ncbi:MAG: hypothetical protein WCI41_01755 [bacterium]
MKIVLKDGFFFISGKIFWEHKSVSGVGDSFFSGTIDFSQKEEGVFQDSRGVSATLLTKILSKKEDKISFYIQGGNVPLCYVVAFKSSDGFWRGFWEKKIDNVVTKGLIIFSLTPIPIKETVLSFENIGYFLRAKGFKDEEIPFSKFLL